MCSCFRSIIPSLLLVLLLLAVFMVEECKINHPSLSRHPQLSLNNSTDDDELPSTRVLSPRMVYVPCTRCQAQCPVDVDPDTSQAYMVALFGGAVDILCIDCAIPSDDDADDDISERESAFLARTRVRRAMRRFRRVRRQARDDMFDNRFTYCMTLSCPRARDPNNTCDKCARIKTAIDHFHTDLRKIPDVLCMRCGVHMFSNKPKAVSRYVCESEAEWTDVTLFPQLRHMIPGSNDTSVWMNYEQVNAGFGASHYISATSQHINYTCESCNKSLIKNNLKNVCADYCTPLQMTELEDKQLLASTTRTESVYDVYGDQVLLPGEQMMLSCVKMSTDVVKMSRDLPGSRHLSYPRMDGTMDPVLGYDDYGMMGMPVQTHPTIPAGDINDDLISRCTILLRRINPIVYNLYTTLEVNRMIGPHEDNHLGAASHDQYRPPIPICPLRVVEGILRQGRGAFEFEAAAAAYDSAPFGYMTLADGVESTIVTSTIDEVRRMPAGTIVLRDEDHNGIHLDNILLLPSGGMRHQSGHMPSSILITVEGALFPSLFPDANGTWKDSPDYVAATHYHKIRLLGPDPRFRQCAHYIFFLFDRYLRRRLATEGVQIKQAGEAVKDDALEAGCPPYDDDALRDLLQRVDAIRVAEHWTFQELAQRTGIRAYEISLLFNENEPVFQGRYKWGKTRKESKYAILWLWERQHMNPDNPTHPNPTGAGDRGAKSKWWKIPESIVGSPKYWQARLRELVACIALWGAPSIFLTLTLNEAGMVDIWMQCGFPEGMNPGMGGPWLEEHAVVITQHYERRVREFMSRFVTGGLEIFGPVDHYWGRHESQGRQTMHYHVAIWLKDRSKCEIRATVPGGHTPEAQLLREMVQRLQRHECEGRFCKTGPYENTEKCKYSFPADKREQDGLDPNGVRWEYRRATDDDLRTSPFVALALLVWMGHLNIQFCSTDGVVAYLCKYAAKANPHKFITIPRSVVVDTGMHLPPHAQREIAAFLMSQVIGLPEAVFHLLELGLTTFWSRSHNAPQKVTISIPDKSYRSRFLGVQTASKMEKYLERPTCDLFETMLYVPFFTDYDVGPRVTDPQRIRAITAGTRRGEYLDVNNRLVTKRKHPIVPIIDFLTPLDGERFYFKALLEHRSFRSLGDLCDQASTDSHCPYREQCFRTGIFSSEEDACLYAMRDAQRRLMTTDQLDYYDGKFDDHLTALRSAELMDSGLLGPENDESTSENTYRPLPSQLLSPCDIVDLDYEDRLAHWHQEQHEAHLAALIQQLPVQQPNAAQASILQYIRQQHEEGSQLLLHIAGGGGVGKSWITRKIMSLLMDLGKAPLLTSTTGVSMRELGSDIATTFHASFGFPPHHEQVSTLKPGTVQWVRLGSVDYVLIDEVSMLPAQLLYAFHDVACKARQQSTSKPLGGLNIILIGDLFQLPPVSNPRPFRPPADPIYRSPFWRLFKLALLTESQRHIDDPQWATTCFRLRIGQQTDDDVSSLKSRCSPVPLDQYRWRYHRLSLAPPPCSQ